MTHLQILGSKRSSGADHAYVQHSWRVLSPARSEFGVARLPGSTKEAGSSCMEDGSERA